MEYNILFLFFKISVFIPLTWICHFYNKENSLNKYLNDKCDILRKLNPKNYRLLAKYEDKNYFIVNFKEETPQNEVAQKKCITNNKKGTNGKQKFSNSSSLYIEEYNRNNEKSKSGISKAKKYSNFEKKIFKELDYKDYLKNVKIIDDKEYKKISRKKRRIRIALLLLFFLVLILPILDLSLEKLKCGGLLGLLGLLNPKNDTVSGIRTLDVEGGLITLFNIGEFGASKAVTLSTILFYCLPFLIFVVIFIVYMVYYNKKVIKYENIKFKKRLNTK
ncbi:fam-l protein [Plasmodium malariae]|nr:fam-l protein [Plasmodium malariae]SBT87262.1 fam-l protein [Plasmodium malariae]